MDKCSIWQIAIYNGIGKRRSDNESQRDFVTRLFNILIDNNIMMEAKPLRNKRIHPTDDDYDFTRIGFYC